MEYEVLWCMHDKLEVVSLPPFHIHLFIALSLLTHLFDFSSILPPT